MSTRSTRKRFCLSALWLQLGSVLLPGSLLLAGQPAWAAQPVVAVGKALAGDRIVTDPCLHLRWHVIEDSGYPGGPGRLILGEQTGKIQEPSGGLRSDRQRVPVGEQGPGPAGQLPQEASVRPMLVVARIAALPPVIHAGDRIVVDQDTEFVHARFPATALDTVAEGVRLRARLEVGRGPLEDGKAPVIWVVAADKGVARWSTTTTGNQGP